MQAQINASTDAELTDEDTLYTTRRFIRYSFIIAVLNSPRVTKILLAL